MTGFEDVAARGTTTCATTTTTTTWETMMTFEKRGKKKLWCYFLTNDRIEFEAEKQIGL